MVNNVETLYNVGTADRACRSPTSSLGLRRGEEAEVVLGAGRHPVPRTDRLRRAARRLSEFGVFVSGLMMGTLSFDLDDVVTKTTGGLIVLPRDHYLVHARGRTQAEMNHIGKSACDQCSYCTEFCPRYLLGYDVQPHKVMRSLGFTLTGAHTGTSGRSCAAPAGCARSTPVRRTCIRRRPATSQARPADGGASSSSSRSRCGASDEGVPARSALACSGAALKVEEYESDTPFARSGAAAGPRCASC